MKKEFLKFLILLVVAGSAAPAYSAWWQWSRTASNNATADPSINFAEGQSPSSLNDSARALMARAAEFRDDTSGLLIATGNGAGTVFTVTTYQGLASTPNDGQMLSFRPTVSNGSSPTLAADGGTAFPIISGTGPSVPVPGGTILPGVPYVVMFSTVNSAWILRSYFGNALTVPLGAMLPFTGTVAPSSNFVFPAGQCLSTTTYATYWALLGSPASGTCAGGQFRIVDLSGRVPAGLDTMPGFGAASRLTSSATGCGTAMTSVGAVCANGVEGSVITLSQAPTGITSSGSNLISVASTVSDIVRAPNGVVSSNATGGINGQLGANTGLTAQITSTGSNSVSVTSNNTGGTTRPQVMPTIGLTYLLRVL